MRGTVICVPKRLDRELENLYREPTARYRSHRDARWLRLAAKAASTATGRWRVGCVIVRGGRVLAVAANSPRNEANTCPGRLWHMSEHAEEAAVRMTGSARGATAYVVRVGRDGRWRHAQPCIRCQALLDEFEIKAVWSADPEYVATRAEG